MEPYVSAQQVAEYLNITRRQVLVMTRRTILPGHWVGIGSKRGLWRYKLTEVDSALAPATKEPPEAGVGEKTRSFSNTMATGSPRSRRGNYNG
jgi:hypothetical protein